MLRRRRQTWYIKVRVPVDVQVLDGRKWVERSLKTRDCVEAKRRYRVLVGQLEQRWEALRTGLTAETTAGKHIQSLATLVSQQSREGLPKAEARVLLMEALESLLSQREVDSEGNPSVTEEELTVIQDGFERVERSDEYHLSSGVDDYMSDLAQRGVTEAHQNATGATLRALKEWIGPDLPVQALSRSQASSHVDYLRAQLAPGTVKSRISKLTSFMGWLQQRDRVSTNVFSGTGRQVKEKVISRRRPWSSDELSAALQQLPVDTPEGQLVRLGMYSGLRTEEMSNLTADDVEQHGDRLVLRVRASKTDAGVRAVPVHREIHKMVLGMMSGGGSLLQFESAAQRRGRSLGGRVLRVLRESGAISEGAVVHSLRNTFATKLEQGGVSENLGQQLMGHRKASLSFGLYSGGASIEQLITAVDAVRY